MRKTILSILLALVMICTLLPVTAMADVPLTSLTVTYTKAADGTPKSITAKFGWGTAGAPARLALMGNRLRSAGETGTDASLGDFTDFGFYKDSFDSWNAVLNKDNTEHTFSIVAYGAEQTLSMNNTNTVTLDLSAESISLTADKIYYVYLWTFYYHKYYPDALVCAIKVDNSGALQFAPATDRNSYDTFKTASITTSVLIADANVSGATNAPATSPVKVGDKLEAILLNVPDGATLTYNWMVSDSENGSGESKGTDKFYTVKEADQGKYIWAVVSWGTTNDPHSEASDRLLVGGDTADTPPVSGGSGHTHTRRQNTTTTTDTTPATTVASPKTGDMGIAVYAALSIMSVTGSAWIVGTKRRH